MNETLIRKTNLFGAWCGVGYVVMLFLGWWVIGGFFPMHRPAAGAEEIAAFYQEDVNMIKLGMVVVMWGAGVFLPFTATIADYVARVEGRVGPLSRIVTMAGFANAMLTFYPPMYWLTAAFRPERSAELLYVLNDIAWLQFIGGLSLAMPLFFSVGVAAMSDKSANPAFPRWCGFASFLAFVLMLPDQLLFFFKSGPFAWNGLISFWVPISVFASWFLMIFWVLRQAILRESQSGNRAAQGSGALSMSG